MRRSVSSPTKMVALVEVLATAIAVWTIRRSASPPALWMWHPNCSRFSLNMVINISLFLLFLRNCSFFPLKTMAEVILTDGPIWPPDLRRWTASFVLVVLHTCNIASIFLDMLNSIARELCATMRRHWAQSWYPPQAEVFPLALVSTEHLPKLVCQLGVSWSILKNWWWIAAQLRLQPFSLASSLQWRAFGRKVAGPVVSSHPWFLQHCD